LHPSIAIHVRPTTGRQRRQMGKALATLGHPILRRHPWLAAFYARATMRARTRPLAMMLRLATRFDRMAAKPIGTSGGLHDREEPLEGARDKLERHLFSVRIRITVAGIPSRAFSIETLPPPKPPRGPARAAKVRNASRHRYGLNVAQVQTEIAAVMAG
jgi:hypothetical protein